jgi:3-hydroxyacyl-CoA dehydrogenase / enoyl-CoA hydratase / 3-hydroxybutyryl-CoA epimerase
MQNHLLVDVDAEGFVTATLRTPGRPMNMMTPECVAELGALIERLAGDAALRGLIIVGHGKSFMAGADLKALVEMYDKQLSPAEAFEFSHSLNRLLRRLETCGKPVVAAINGVALGAGFELCLACHYRVLVDAAGAVVGLPEVKVGLLPGAGGTQRLPRLIGVEKALPRLLDGTHLVPAEALKLGVVHEVVQPAALLETARRWLQSAPEPVQPWDRKAFKVPGGAGMSTPGTLTAFTMASAQIAKSTYHNYPAPIAIASCVFEGSQVPMDAALRIESRYFAQLLLDPVSRNLIRTMFINKGLADKLARRPKEVPTSHVTTLGVLGAGMMGAGIACVSAKAGMHVVLLDRTQELAEKGKAYARSVLEKDVARGRGTQQQSDEILARIEATENYARLERCNLVVEAVFESRDIKADVSVKAEAVIGADAVLATNTSTLPITGLARAVRRADRFIGIHFFSPVEKMPLVEIIVGKQTSPQTLARALDYVAQLKKTPIVVSDSRNFYTSRVFGTFVHEGLSMLAEGVAPALIENAARMAGMPVGPLAVSDEVTIDLQWQVLAQTERDLGAEFRKPAGYDVIREFAVNLKRGGKRFGKGFYEYPENGAKHLWPGLEKTYPRSAEQPPVEELKRRFLHIQALEAARCVEEGIVHPVDADLGSVLGWGYPAYTGGAISHIDTVGPARFVQECEQLARRHGARFQPSPWLTARTAAGQTFHTATDLSSAA